LGQVVKSAGYQIQGSHQIQVSIKRKGIAGATMPFA